MKRAFPVEVLWCPNARQGRGNGWSFPPAVLKHLQSECAGKSVLQAFGGRSAFGTRLDVDPMVKPDVIGDAWLLPFRQDAFDVVILDPPYFHLNAQIKTALYRAAATVAREQVIWFSTVWMAATGGLRLEKSYLVRVGDSCHVRCLQHFRVIRKEGPTRYFARGPAMKYNRWLSQPNGFAFTEASECELANRSAI